MIPGTAPRNVARYMPIAHGGEDFSYETPSEGERFIGIPWGYCEHQAQPFIEVWRGENLFKTVNALDLAEIEFLEE